MMAKRPPASQSQCWPVLVHVFKAGTWKEEDFGSRCVSKLRQQSQSQSGKVSQIVPSLGGGTSIGSVRGRSALAPLPAADAPIIAEDRAYAVKLAATNREIDRR